MKNNYSSLIILILITFTARAQRDNFYYYKVTKFEMQLDKTTINIIANRDFDANSIQELGFEEFEITTVDTLKYAKLLFKQEPNEFDYLQKLNALKSNPDINHVNLYFKRDAGALPLGISNTFFIKLKSQSDYEVLNDKANLKGAKIVKQIPNMPLWYQLELNSKPLETSLTITSFLWETGLFEEVDPGFLFDFTKRVDSQSGNLTSSSTAPCSNDTNFSALWDFNNTVNPNIDINACQAWDITEGLGLKVAVIDSGIEKTHLDLMLNIDPLSYNMNTGSSPSAIPDYFHGTHIAGTIAAIKNNNIQVVGVAPLSKLIDVSHNGLLWPNLAAAEYASGISWAWQNGAEVINCSWGDQNGLYYTTFHPNNAAYSTLIEDALTSALTLGRNGKGSIVIFASGNNGGIDYPGNFHPDIITVGAINQTGQRVATVVNSAFGAKLDVVAPGVGILSISIDNSIDSQSWYIICCTTRFRYCRTYTFCKSVLNPTASSNHY